MQIIGELGEEGKGKKLDVGIERIVKKYVDRRKETINEETKQERQKGGQIT